MYYYTDCGEASHQCLTLLIFPTITWSFEPDFVVAVNAIINLYIHGVQLVSESLLFSALTVVTGNG